MSKRMSAEMFRRVRLGNIRALLLDRCRGRVLPDDDAGWEYLLDLLAAMSLGRDPRPGMIQASKDWAPWAWEKCKIERAIDDILALPTKQRRITAKALGERLRVTNEERERLSLRTIHPVDMTDEQMAEQKKAKDRARKRRKRARTPRDVWEKNSLSKQQPWLAEGISRRTWERRRKAVASVSAIKEHLPGHTCVTGHSEPLEARGEETKAEAGSAGLRHAPSPSSNSKQIDRAERVSASPPEAEPQAKRTHVRHEAKRTHPVPPQWEKWEGAKWTRT